MRFTKPWKLTLTRGSPRTVVMGPGGPGVVTIGIVGLESLPHPASATAKHARTPRRARRAWCGRADGVEPRMGTESLGAPRLRRKGLFERAPLLARRLLDAALVLELQQVRQR